MKFDFIIGNPPYQEERRGKSTTALPSYHQFMDSAYKLGQTVLLITPARFLFDAGRTPKLWNKKMLNDEHLKVVYFEKEAAKIFPNTDIKGGVAITYRNSEKNFSPIGVFTIYSELNSIIKKIDVRDDSLATLCFVATKFETSTLTQDYPEYNGHERRMSSNVLAFKCFTDKPTESEGFEIYGIYNGSRTFRHISRKYVDTSDRNLFLYKVVLPKADGNGNFGDTLTNPEILTPMTGFTHTFLGLGGFQNEYEARALLKYIKSKFARALLSVMKVTQDMNADKWKLVPLQDFTAASDIDWSKSIPEIDQQLYAKYGLDNAEIEFIETHVKEMN